MLRRYRSGRTRQGNPGDHARVGQQPGHSGRPGRVGTTGKKESRTGKRWSTANLLDLMIQTRIPAGQLVDWLDQALLLLYTSGVRPDPTPDADGLGNSADRRKGTRGLPWFRREREESTRTDLAKTLHHRGIRTATQLLDLVDPAGQLPDHKGGLWPGSD